MSNVGDKSHTGSCELFMHHDAQPGSLLIYFVVDCLTLSGYRKRYFKNVSIKPKTVSQYKSNPIFFFVNK